MSAEKLLQTLAASNMVDEATLRQLRKQLEASKRTVAASKVAKVLVDRGMLTKFQASQLLASLADTDPAPSDDELIEDAGATESATPTLEELQSEPHGLTLLEPVEEELGLQESDEDLPEAIPVAEVVVEAETIEPIVVDEDELPAEEDLLPDETADEFPQSAPRRSVLGAITGIFGRRKVRRGQSWDSLLIIGGGGALILLAGVGILLYLVLAVGSGDEAFAQAQQDYQGQLYRNAIERYGEYIRKYPKHAKVSLAKVRLGLSRIRAEGEMENWVRVLATTETELSKVENEAAFPEARPELGAILTDIYQGLVRQADESQDFDEKRGFLDETSRVRALIDNPKYLPTSMRQSVQGRIEGVGEEVAKIERDINRHDALQQAMTEIDASLEEGSSVKAYAIANQLLGSYPGLQRNAQLMDAQRRTSEAELAGVTVATAGPTPLTEDRQLAAPRIVLARRVVKQPASVDQDTCFALVSGAVYGIGTTDGEVRWRRWVGFDSFINPVRVVAGGSSGVLVWDAGHKELIRIDATTGALVWRVALGQDIASPVVFEDSVLVSLKAGEDQQGGQLLQLRASDGTTQRAVHFPQGLGASPGVDLRRGRLYVPARHSSLYILDAASLACEQVAYIGHAAGMVAVPPVVSADNLFVVENSGEDYCRLRTFTLDAEGLNAAPVGEPVRLNGEVFDPPKTFGRNALLTTDLGEVHSFEADLANPDEPLKLYTQVRSGNTGRHRHYARLVNQRIVVAGVGISEFELRAAQGEIKRKWAYGIDAVHLGPPEILGDTVIVTQARSDSRGARVEALRLPRRGAGDPTSLWQLDLGAPPAVAPFLDRERKRINLVSTGGAVWSLGREDLKLGIADKAIGPQVDIPSLNYANQLDDGRYMLTDDRGTSVYWLYDPTSDPPRLERKSFQIDPGDLVTSPVAMGQRAIVGLRSGQVGVFEASSGQPAILPFQPELAVGPSVDWNLPLVLPEGNILLSTKEGMLYLVREQAAPKPFLAEQAVQDLQFNLHREIAHLGQTVFAVRRQGAVDSVVSIALPDLVVNENPIALGATASWGPATLGDHVVVSTSDGVLWAFSEQGHWSVKLPSGALAGRPLEHDGRWLCNTTDGHLFSIDPNSRQIAQDVPAFDVGEPLSLGPVDFGDRLLLSGRDGTIYFVPQ